MRAGHPGGAGQRDRAIAVQTGITPVEELVELQPDVMLKDLRELRLKRWKWYKLRKPLIALIVNRINRQSH